MTCRTWRCLAAWAIIGGLAFPRGAAAQVGGVGTGTTTSGPAAMLANPYANPYMNPYLNPYMTQFTTNRTDMALYFLSAQQSRGGLLSTGSATTKAAPAPSATREFISGAPRNSAGTPLLS